MNHLHFSVYISTVHRSDELEKSELSNKMVQNTELNKEISMLCLSE